MSTAGPTPADFERIIEVLAKWKVDHVVIGGVAVILQGGNLERTLDLDVTPSRDPKNKRRLAKALRDLEAELRTERPGETVGIPLDERTFEGITTMTFMTRLGPFDVCFEPDGTDGYTDLIRDALIIDVDGVPVRVASMADIIRSKRATGREKDAAHLRRLLDSGG